MRKEKLGNGYVRIKDSFISANDILKVFLLERAKKGKMQYSLGGWRSSNRVLSYQRELEGRFGEVVRTTFGRSGGTWLHPSLALDLIYSTSEEFQLSQCEWLEQMMTDIAKTIKPASMQRQLMIGTLWVRATRKDTFPLFMKNLEYVINKTCKKTGADKEDCYREIALMANKLNNNEKAIRLGMLNVLSYDKA